MSQFQCCQVGKIKTFKFDSQISENNLQNNLKFIKFNKIEFQTPDGVNEVKLAGQVWLF